MVHFLGVSQARFSPPKCVNHPWNCTRRLEIDGLRDEAYHGRGTQPSLRRKWRSWYICSSAITHLVLAYNPRVLSVSLFGLSFAPSSSCPILLPALIFSTPRLFLVVSHRRASIISDPFPRIGHVFACTRGSQFLDSAGAYTHRYVCTPGGTCEQVTNKTLGREGPRILAHGLWSWFDDLWSRRTEGIGTVEEDEARKRNHERSAGRRRSGEWRLRECLMPRTKLCNYLYIRSRGVSGCSCGCPTFLAILHSLFVDVRAHTNVKSLHVWTRAGTCCSIVLTKTYT